ncbi:hypothetical protein GEMRC1_010790 [Eukaryota sp. GEM-RC1]
MGTKTVSGRECQLYQSSSTVNMYGDSVTAEFLHCDADRFVLETEVSFEGETDRVTFSNHKQLSEDEFALKVDGICSYVPDDIVHRQVFFRHWNGFYTEYSIDYHAQTVYMKVPTAEVIITPEGGISVKLVIKYNSDVVSSSCGH